MPGPDRIRCLHRGVKPPPQPSIYRADPDGKGPRSSGIPPEAAGCEFLGAAPVEGLKCAAQGAGSASVRAAGRPTTDEERIEQAAIVSSTSPSTTRPDLHARRRGPGSGRRSEAGLTRFRVNPASGYSMTRALD